MAESSTIDRQFTRALGVAFSYYNADNAEECEKYARDLLADPAIPRYHRIKVLCILASILEDDAEAKAHYLEAEALWQMVRNGSTVGDKSDVDKALDEIRTELDELKSGLDPDEQWTDADQEAFLAEQAEERAALAAEDDDQMALEKADAKALNMTVEEMRKVTLDKRAPKPGQKQGEAADTHRRTAPRPQIPFQTPEQRKAFDSFGGPKEASGTKKPTGRK